MEESLIGDAMYEPSRNFLTFNVAGFKHHDGALVLKDMQVGDRVSLVGEPDNPYDSEAVAIYFNGTKLGYVPSECNGMLSLMLYYGHFGVFEGIVQAVRPDANPWEQVRIGVYVKDVRPK
jgi:hypothetical protein